MNVASAAPAYGPPVQWLDGHLEHPATIRVYWNEPGLSTTRSTTIGVRPGDGGPEPHAGFAWRSLLGAGMIGRERELPDTPAVQEGRQAMLDAAIAAGPQMPRWYNNQRVWEATFLGDRLRDGAWWVDVRSLSAEHPNPAQFGGSMSNAPEAIADLIRSARELYAQA